MPLVSLSPTTSAAVILPSFTVRVTETSPMPCAVPVYVSAEAAAIAPVAISMDRRMDANFFMKYILLL